nr:uncharacterized protein LOC119165354 [Rhipicephalus microplus]
MTEGGLGNVVLKVVKGPFDYFPYTMTTVRDGKRQVYGLTGSLFGNITASLNISYDLLDSVDEHWGNLLDDGDFTGPLGMLQRNTMLLLFATMAVLVVISAVSLHTARRKWMSTLQWVFWVYAESLLLKSTSTSRLRSTASRILLGSWMIGTLVIGQYIMGQVKAAMLIRSPVSHIDTLEEMLSRRPPIRPVTLKATPLMNMLQLSGLDSYRTLHGRIKRMNGELQQSEVYSMRTLRQVVAGETVIIMDATGNRVFVAPHCDKLQPAFFHVSQQRIETADFRWYMNKRLDARLVAAMDRRIRWLLEGAVPFMHHHEIFRKPATCFLNRNDGSGSDAAAGQYEVLHLEDVQASFIILLWMLAFATLVLLLESIFHKSCVIGRQ